MRGRGRRRLTPTDRIISGVTARLNGYRSSLDAMPDLNSITITVQLDRFGPGQDKIIIQPESGHQTKPVGVARRTARR